MSHPLAVLFAPVMRAECWTSIDLQQQNILEALRAHPEPPRLSTVRMSESLARVPFGRQFLRDAIYPHRIRAQAAAIGRCVLHVTDQSYGHLCRAHQPCIVNCNDLHHFVRPELNIVHLRRWKQRVEGMRQADRILAISAHLANEVREHLGLSEERVVALPGGVDSSVFRPLPLDEAAAMLPHVAALRPDCSLVLNIGTNLARKNLPTLLRALRILVHGRRWPAKLLKIGPPLRGSEHEKLIGELGLADAIVDLGNLSPNQVAAACRLSNVLSFPSLYEGFGRPTLEAQACELPCVLADSSCMREIGGAGARFHPPTNHEHLAADLMEVLGTTGVRASLVAAGLENAARFTWSRYAERLIAIYREVGP